MTVRANGTSSASVTNGGTESSAMRRASCNATAKWKLTSKRSSAAAASQGNSSAAIGWLADPSSARDTE